jgi:hypothetical protein
MDFELSSSAFDQGGTIPARHTADGANVSPALEWTTPPEDTAALALVCEDPDAPAGTWTHWLLYDLPADTQSLPENVPAREEVLGSARQGMNDFGKYGYGGPAPPRGSRHRYFFKLMALDGPLGLAAGASRQELLAAVGGHLLGEAELMGYYQR